MHQGKAKETQLIIYPDGTLYHIDLKRDDDIPKNIFLAGAAERVDAIANHFDRITFKHQNTSRPEFYIAAGTYKGIRMAAMSSGIGMATIDVVINELHGMFEYNYAEENWDLFQPHINIIRVGTAGTSLKDVPLGALAISKYAIGLDNLGVFYPRPVYFSPVAADIAHHFKRTKIGSILNLLSGFCCYVSQANPEVTEALELAAARHLKNNEPAQSIISGITTASPGFFGPEGRTIGRIKTLFSQEQFVETMANFEVGGLRIVNHEMETSILFRLANEILGYRAGAICTVLDNLQTDEMIDSEFAKERVDVCIRVALEAMVDLANNP